MHYVKHFNINGVDTKQVACIELQGAPNAATEGAVGVLGMDMSSPTHDVYRCVAVNGSVYTWELLSSGMSIICAIITYEGSERATFEYTDLRIPNNYLIKSGDLILDADGYLYQITAIGNSSCATEHCGIHLSNKSTSKDYNLRVKDGVLQLVTENGNVINNIDYLLADGKTIYRDPNTGKASVLGIRTITNELLYFFVGTQDEYDALTEAQKQNLFAIITNDTTKEGLLNALAELRKNYEELQKNYEALAEAHTAKKYLHQISISGDSYVLLFSLILSTDTPPTDSLINLIGSVYGVAKNKLIAASGVHLGSTNSAIYAVQENGYGGTLKVYTTSGVGEITTNIFSTHTINDIVTALHG